MAEITNRNTGPGLLAARIDFLTKEPERGKVARQQVVMNSDLGLLWTNASFLAGEREIFSQHILLHSRDIRRWGESVQAMLNADPNIQPTVRKITPYGFENRLDFDSFSSPELILRVTQHVFTPEKKRSMYQGFPQDAWDERSIKLALASYYPGISQEALEKEFRDFILTTYSYELLVAVDTAVSVGTGGFRGEGPGVYMRPEANQLLDFARDLRSEAEIALLLGEE
jgi:hypothetical protein